MVKKKPHPDVVVTQGSHLRKQVDSFTGEVKLSWDWDALQKEVDEATASVSVVVEKPKRGRKPKS